MRGLQNALFREVPAAECAFPHLGKRRVYSRKGALCPDGLTQKRILDSTPHAKAHSGGSEDPRAHLSVRTSYRMRFSVTCRLQNALFRRVRFFSPGQMRRRLTKRRTLSRRSHGKAHSVAARCATVYTNDPKRRREVIFANLCTLLRPHVCPDEEKRIVAPTVAFVRHAKAHFVRMPMVRVCLSVRHTVGKRMPIPVPPSSTSWQPGAPRGYRGAIMARRQRRPKARRARRP